MNKYIHEALDSTSEWKYTMLLAANRVRVEIENIQDPEAKRVALQKYKAAYKKVGIMADNLKSVCLEMRSVEGLVKNYAEMEDTSDM